MSWTLALTELLVFSIFFQRFFFFFWICFEQSPPSATRFTTTRGCHSRCSKRHAGMAGRYFGCKIRQRMAFTPLLQLLTGRKSNVTRVLHRFETRTCLGTHTPHTTPSNSSVVFDLSSFPLVKRALEYGLLGSRPFTPLAPPECGFRTTS